jgi:hypothetical protein
MQLYARALNLTYTTMMHLGKVRIFRQQFIYKGGGASSSWNWPEGTGSTTLSLPFTRHRLFDRGCTFYHNVYTISTNSLEISGNP